MIVLHFCRQDRPAFKARKDEPHTHTSYFFCSCSSISCHMTVTRLIALSHMTVTRLIALSHMTITRLTHFRKIHSTESHDCPRLIVLSHMTVTRLTALSHMTVTRLTALSHMTHKTHSTESHDLRRCILPPSTCGAGHRVSIGVQFNVEHSRMVSIWVDGSGTHGRHFARGTVGVWENGPHVESLYALVEECPVCVCVCVCVCVLSVHV